MSENTPDVVWLTQDAFDTLEAELNNLKNDGRAEVTARISAARDEGDLSENGGYHAAKEEQGQMEGRILQLEHLLRTAHLGETEGADDEATPGRVITVAFDGDLDVRSLDREHAARLEQSRSYAEATAQHAGSDQQQREGALAGVHGSR